MPEERGLYPQMGVLEQVAYFGRLHGLDRRAARRNARAVLDRLGLADRVEDKLVALSHGNQQRAQLAVALVHEPDLLVLDEAFAGLDPTAVMVLGEVLREEARRHAAVLFSSHQLDIVERLCDRVAVMEAGRLLATGTLDELQRRLPRRLRVRVGGGARWAPSMPGARRVGDVAGGALFELAPGVDPQALIRSAMAAGPVEHFAFERGSLIDVYRELVAP
jgi:ABC-2 type transport system ATP-binding protein